MSEFFMTTNESYDEISSLLNVSFNNSLNYDVLLSTFSPQIKNINDSNLIMEIWIEFAWIFIFTALIITSTGGNSIVIWIVIAHRRMRTVTNYFLVNLSTADLLLTTLNCIFNFTYMIQRNWPFGGWYCSISNFIANSTVAASVFTLTGISYDRYLAIVHPLKPRMTKKYSIFIILFIWMASMMLALPCLLYSTTITTKYHGKEMTACILVWPDEKLVGSEFDFMYQMMFLIVTYIIPVTLMILSYSIMGKELWGSSSIGEISQRQNDSISAKRRVVKMFILVVLIFAICWLPYHIYFIYIYYDTNIIYSKYTQHIYLAFYWFAMSNAMVNPLIYYWMNNRFRQYFQTAICGWKQCIYERNLNGKHSLRSNKNFNSYTKSGRCRTDEFDLQDKPKRSTFRKWNISSSKKTTNTTSVPL